MPQAIRTLVGRLLDRSRRGIPLSPDLPEVDRKRVLADMRACLDRSGGALAALRRTDALVAAYGKLTPLGRARFAETIVQLDVEHSSEHYARIEETELFGRPADKLAILESFTPPARRMLELIRDAADGDEVLDGLRQDDRLSAEIDAVAVRKRKRSPSSG